MAEEYTHAYMVLRDEITENRFNKFSEYEHVENIVGKNWRG